MVLVIFSSGVAGSGLRGSCLHYTKDMIQAEMSTLFAQQRIRYKSMI